MVTPSSPKGSQQFRGLRHGVAFLRQPSRSFRKHHGSILPATTQSGQGLPDSATKTSFHAQAGPFHSGSPSRFLVRWRNHEHASRQAGQPDDQESNDFRKALMSKVAQWRCGATNITLGLTSECYERSLCRAAPGLRQHPISMGRVINRDLLFFTRLTSTWATRCRASGPPRSTTWLRLCTPPLATPARKSSTIAYRAVGCRAGRRGHL